MFRILIFVFLSMFAIGFSAVTYAADQPTTGIERAANRDGMPRNTSDPQKLRFVDEDGDGLNDLIIDRNGDGIPDGRMRDGSGQGNAADRGNMNRQGVGSGGVHDAVKMAPGVNSGSGFRHKSGQR
jgi:hypothetical protein